MTTTNRATINIPAWNTQAPSLTAQQASKVYQWSVIPLDADKKPVKTGGVHSDGNPKRLGWKAFQERCATEQELHRWTRNYHPSAWAVVTGKISNLVTLDFDGDQGKKTLELLGLQPHRRTGSGGYHVDFKHPGWHVKTVNSKSSKDRPWVKQYPGLDIRADGGYVAFCGSNESGAYQWLREPILDDLAILPADLRMYLGLMVAPSPIDGHSNSSNLEDILLDQALGKSGIEGRNNAGLWLGCQLRDNRFSQPQVESILLSYAHRVGTTNTKGQHEPFTDEEARAIVRSVFSAPARQPWDLKSTQEYRPVAPATGSNGSGKRSNNGHIQVDKDNLDFIIECLHQAEWGDALLFAHLFRGQVIYDHIEKEWYTWRSHYWEKDTLGKIKYYVSGQLASVYISAGAMLNLRVTKKEEEAEASGNEEDKAAALASVSKLKGLIVLLTERAFKLRGVARNKNILIFASSLDGIGITADKWDINKWLLGLPNGVLDLRTGECREGRPEDYIRTIAPTEWQGLNTPAPRFERFLAELFEDRTEDERRAILAFLQRLLGYGITGEVIEHIFAVLYGEDGRNGKDTLQHALTRALGAASGAISKDVFLDMGRQHAAGGATPHLCDLQGKRLAWASEPEKGTRFNVGQVKELSGGGEIPVRPLYAKDYYKIQPTHLLILLTNHKPHADANDSAFWDRLRLITFKMRFVDSPKDTNERKKETTLWDALEQEAPGILAWLVRGCLMWQAHGLDTPTCILDAGNAYRKEEDTIAQFLDERCDTREPQVETKASKIYQAYEAWCDAGNLNKLNSTNFGRQLSKRFAKTAPTRDGIFYKGIRILPSGDENISVSPAPDQGTLVNSLWNDQNTVTPASQAGLEATDTPDREQCEGFLQEVPNIPISNPL